MTSRYKKPPLYSIGGADDYQAVLDWQAAELEHESAGLDGRPCRCDACNRPKPEPDHRTPEERAAWCVACGGSKGDGIFGMCETHYQERVIAERKARYREVKS